MLNNGPRPVRAATRMKVLDTMRRLEFHPNAMARGLVHRRINTIGVLFGKVEPAIVTNAYATAVLEGIFTASAEAGFNVTLFTEPWSDAEQSAAPFRDRRTDGVVVVAPLSDSDMAEGLAALGMPVVVVSAPCHDIGLPSVDVDNEKGARLAAEHLLSLGHTRIAHVMGSENQSSVAPRRQGFLNALSDAGVTVPPHYLVSSAYSLSLSYESARRLLEMPDRPTAVFGGNDFIALSTLRAANDLGLRVPEDLSIVGFDDIQACSLVQPPLTTIRQPLSEMGQRAVRLLAAKINHEPVADTTEVYEPSLIVRGSTASPPPGL